MSTVYVTGELAELLAAAEGVIYRHLNCCVLCASHRGCLERDHAESLFARYGLLPRRTPGLTRP